LIKKKENVRAGNIKNCYIKMYFSSAFLANYNYNYFAEKWEEELQSKKVDFGGA